ncbi:MAG: hypothetical protein H0T73_18545 [Ardenticatenales bacterium]|nr:hypothetical protein [Ardenticatenales bacterium]
MAGYTVPENVSAFVIEHIHSVEHLEILLLLQKSPEKVWNATEVSQALSFHPASTATRLAELHTYGLLEVKDQEKTTSPPRYCFSPKTAALAAAVTSLAEVYKHRPVAVITLIYSKPQDHIRSFSDAFKLKKDKDEES